MSSFRIDESTTVEAKIADLESKAERYTSSWQTEVVQFMFTAECGINELGEKYDSLQEEYEILRQEMSEISQLKSNHDTNYIERLKSLEEDMERKLAGIKEEYSQKLVSYTVTPAVLQGEASEINETHRPQLPSSTSEYSNAEKKILTKHILTLSYDLIIDEVLVYLQAKFILSRVDVQNIKAELTPFARNHALIQCLMCRDGQAFLLFVRSLRKSKQHRLANILSPSKPTASSSKKIKQQSGEDAEKSDDDDRSSVRAGHTNAAGAFSAYDYETSTPAYGTTVDDSSCSIIASRQVISELQNEKMETDDALGSARRNKWTTGAGGGGGHQDAATHALADSKSTSRSSTGVRKNLVGLGSHESLQPFSRDASKSRKSSIADSDSERQQALKLTSQIVSSRPLLDASHSPVPDSAHPAALADSNGTPSPSITSGPTDANDIDIDIDEDRIQRGILHDVKEYCTDAVKIQEVFDEMMERCAQAPPSTIFRLLMKAAVEETLNAHDRRYIGQLLCRCLQADHIRAEALKGIADYARSAINDELWVDVPNLWEYMAEVLLWAILCDMKHFDGHRPSLDDFAETFQTAQQDTRKPHVLLLLVLKRLFETFDEKGVAQFAFAEMRVISPDTPDLIEALKATTVDGSDLYTLLTQ